MYHKAYRASFKSSIAVNDRELDIVGDAIATAPRRKQQ